MSYEQRRHNEEKEVPNMSQESNHAMWPPAGGDEEVNPFVEEAMDPNPDVDFGDQDDEPTNLPY